MAAAIFSNSESAAPCLRVREGVRQVLAAGKPSRWVPAGQAVLLRGESLPGGRAGEPPLHQLRARYEPTARYFRALTPGTSVHRRWP